MTPYDGNKYSPPAPAIAITLRTLSGESKVVPKVLALMDTGADVSVLPRWAVEQLGSLPTIGESTTIEWFDGSQRLIDCIDVEVTFLEGKFRGRYMVDDQPHGIIGRDLLNHFKLVFDGPAKVWQRT